MLHRGLDNLSKRSRKEFVSILFGLNLNCIKYMHLKFIFQIIFHFFEKMSLDALLVLFYKT